MLNEDNEQPDYHYIFKIIIIGSSFVGKSNILSRYAYNQFSNLHEATLGCDYTSKQIKIDEKNVLIQIWDTAGQEVFRSITRSYYKNTSCALVVFDVTDMKSFTDANEWLNECREMCSRNVQVILIGNKTDLKKKRIISKEQGKQYAEDNDIDYFETSALTGEGVKEVFDFAVRSLVANTDYEEEENTKLKKINTEKDNKCAC